MGKKEMTVEKGCGWKGRAGLCPRGGKGWGHARDGSQGRRRLARPRRVVGQPTVGDGTDHDRPSRPSKKDKRQPGFFG